MVSLAFISFLKKNGFVKVEVNSYSNPLGTNVVIDNDEVQVANSYGEILYCSENFYSIIGYLFFHKLILQNYKIIPI